LSFHYFLAFFDFSPGAPSALATARRTRHHPFHFQPFIYFRHEIFCQKSRCSVKEKIKSGRPKTVSRKRAARQIEIARARE